MDEVESGSSAPDSDAVNRSRGKRLPPLGGSDEDHVPNHSFAPPFSIGQHPGINVIIVYLVQVI